MHHLSSPAHEIGPVYDALVIGSGYGGSVAALRASEAGLRTAVLEKGHEYPYQNFPDTLRGFLNSSQINGAPDESRLYDFRLFRDLNIFSAAGLGGGSLINAGVMMRPPPALFENPRWPRALRGDDLLDRAYARVLQLLEPAVYPTGQPGYPPLDKTVLLKNAADRLGYQFEPVNLTIRFADSGYNGSGAYQAACKNCGNCLTGCNHAAKNSLDKNYLHRARQLGAQLFTGVRVSHIEKRGPEYLAHYRLADSPAGALSVVRASRIFLGAGALGSTEILLRSRELGGLSFSPTLGTRFSANSGRLGGVYNGRASANMVGLASHVRASRRSGAAAHAKFTGTEKRSARANSKNFVDPVGPTITACLKTDHDEAGFVIEDAAAPGASSHLFPVWWTALAALQSGTNLFASLRTLRAIARSLLSGPYAPDGAIRHTGLFLGVGHDDAGGILRLSGSDVQQARVDLVWPGAGLRSNYQAIDAAMARIADATGGRLMTNQVLPMNPITVHALGGCGMGETAESGVVNHRCEVFDPTQGPGAVHAGLYVVDAAALPGSLGVNPLWTISALAERALELALPRRTTAAKESINEMENETVQTFADTRSPRPPIPLTNREGVVTAEVSEELDGYWAPGASSARAGLGEGTRRGLSGRILLKLRIQIADVDQFLSNPEHEARLAGEVDCPGLDLTGPMPVLDGAIRLFERSADAARNRFMRYRLLVRTTAGRSYRIVGQKTISAGPTLRALRELTELDIVIEEETDRGWRIYGGGVVRVDLADFLRRTLLEYESRGGGQAERVRARLQIYGFFAGECLDAYGVKLVRTGPLSTPGPVQIMRGDLSGIRSGKVSVERFFATDGLGLSLTRAIPERPAIGSILLIHGLTSSSDMYIMPEHENLAEFLLRRGYEVWLLDSRMSCRFPYNTLPHNWTLEEAAALDMVPAVETVRRNIAPDAKLHVIAHCLGSLAFSLSLFGKMLPDGAVSSFISNAVSLNVKLPAWSALKMQLLLESGLMEKALRIERMAPDSLAGEDWLLRWIAEGVSRLSHECDNPYCHALSFMWGAGPSAVFEHKNLAPETHARLHQLFGPTSFAFHRNVMQLHRLGHTPRKNPAANGAAVDFHESARTNTTRTLFVRGERNKVFGESQDLSYRMCRAYNPAIYKHAIFEGYGHQDIFIGKNSAIDVFPELVRFIEARQQA